MPRFRTPPEHLDHETAATMKGMLARGDRVEDIAVWFGLSVRVVHSVQSGAVHPFLAPAPKHALPPPGPYAEAACAYSALADINVAEQRLLRLAVNARSAHD
jgi:hypothetical protein